MKYIRNNPSDNMITVLLCHDLLLAGIMFDVEYSPNFRVPLDWGLKQIPKGTPNRKKLSVALRAQEKYKRKVESGVIKGRRVRFDIVIINDDNIVGIIETKGTKQEAAAQLARYKTFGIPVFLCCGAEEISNAVKFAKGLGQVR